MNSRGRHDMRDRDAIREWTREVCRKFGDVAG